MGLRLPVVTAASIVVSALMIWPSRAQAQSTALDQPANVVSFTVYASKIFKVQREGRFTDVIGQLAYDPARPADTRVDLTVRTASVDMNSAEHDQLLKSEAFFDVDRYPTMHFASSAAVMKPDGTLSMTGDLTIRGITRKMTIPVSLRRDSRAHDTPGAILETTFQIDRTEFGLNGIPNWKGFKASISKNVQIHIAIASAARGTRLAR